LAAAGWLYEAGDNARYDRTQALFVDDAIAWIKTSQPKTWEAIKKSHGAAAPKLSPSACASHWTARERWRCCGRGSR